MRINRPRFVSGLGWARPIVTRVPGQGWLTDGLEVRMRPDRARQLETTCREGLGRLHGLGPGWVILAGRGCESAAWQWQWPRPDGLMATFRSVVHATSRCRAVALRVTLHARKVKLAGSCVVMADCACLSEAAPRDFLKLVCKVGRLGGFPAGVIQPSTFARAMKTGDSWLCYRVPRYLCGTVSREALAGVELQPW